MPIVPIIIVAVLAVIFLPKVLFAGRVANTYDRLQFTPVFLRFLRLRGTNAYFELEVETSNPSQTEIQVQYLSYDIALSKGGMPIVQIRYDADTAQPTEIIRIPAQTAQRRISVPFRVNVLTSLMAVATGVPPGKKPSGKDDAKRDAGGGGILSPLIAIVKEGRYPKSVFTTGEASIKGVALPIRIEDYEYQFAGK